MGTKVESPIDYIADYILGKLNESGMSMTPETYSRMKEEIDKKNKEIC